MNSVHHFGPTHEVPAGATARFFRHGWHSWCETAWLDPTRPPKPITDRIDRMGHADPLHAFDTDHGGAGVGAVEHPDGSITLLGALDPGGWVHLRGGVLSGAYEDSSGGWVVLDGDEEAVFAGYAEALAANLGRRGGERVRLWCSWYSHFEGVTEQLMHDALAGLTGIPVDIVQVDDGWQEAVGDWTANGDFPDGMAAMAQRITAAGRRAGLWLAPFIAARNSRLASDRPELFLRDVDGAAVVAGVNWGTEYLALDVTSPATLDWLAELMLNVRSWGYDFLKLDFLYAAGLPGNHHTPTPRAVAYRRAVEHIRDAVGDDAYLLACGAPVIESLGVFDGLRVGPDVGPEWDDGTWAAARPAMSTAINRLWLRPAIDTDPDVVYFRTRNSQLSDDAKRRLLAMAQVAGFMGTSDPPGWLSADEFARLERAFTTAPTIRRVGRYRWEINGRAVDLSIPMEATGTPRHGQEAP